MSSEINEGELSAWERYEMACFDDPVAIAEKNRKADAATITPPSVEEIEQIRQQAHDDAYATGHAEGRAAGHAEGHAAGYAEGQAKALDECTRFGSMVTHLNSALTEFDQQVAEGLLALALDIARQVIRQTIAVKPEVLLKTVNEALSQMPYPHATIHLNPEDASLIRSYMGDQLTHAGHRIHEDQRLERGGCTVEANSSQVDATLPTRWRRTVEGLGSNVEWLDTPSGSGAESPDEAAPAKAALPIEPK